MQKVKYRKYLTVLVWVAVIISLIPIFYIAGADRATGDDWSYGLLTHRAWLETHSLWNVLLAACKHVKNIYYSWQGTWFSVFLFTLQPEVFSHEAYWIVPYIMVFLLVLSLSFVLYQLLVRGMQMSVWDYLLIDAVLLLVIIQFVPYKTAGLFWYNGAVHYTVAFSIALLSIGFALRYQRTFCKRDLAGASVFMALLGGMNYLSAFFALLLVLLLIICFSRKTKRTLWLILPVVLEMTGLLISALAPGNAMRGGEGYRISIGRIAAAVLESFRQGSLGIFRYMQEYPVMMAGMLITAVLLWEILQELVEKEKVHFPLPGIVIFYFFGTYCAVYWPVVFVEDVTYVSQGVPNMYYWAFVLMFFCSMIYGLGWLAQIRRKNQKEKDNRKYRLHLFVIAAALFIAAINYRTVKESTFYICYRHIKSGQTKDYKERMDEVTKILLDEQEKDVILPGIFEDETPFMNIPITTDPDEWTNQKVSAFFGKDSVIAVPREIYEDGVTEEELEELREQEKEN